MTSILFLAEGFEEVEALTPVDYLRRVGVEVVTAACGSSLQVTGSHGITVLADTFASGIAEKITAGSVPEAVIIPGGMPGASNVAGCDAARKTIEAVHNAGGITAAICAAPVVVFAPLGLLAGKSYTCYPGMEEQMEKWCGMKWRELTADARYTGERCVQDGNLVTAAGPGAAEEFAVRLARTLAGEAAAEKLISGSIIRR